MSEHTDHDGRRSFDERAATWDDEPRVVERASVIADAIRSAVDLGPQLRVLEYGAGTGLLSQALAADVGPITLADPSAGMREVVADKIASGALPSDARVTDLDLARDPAVAERFDLVVTMMALHHVPAPAPVLEGFAALLVPGGALCVADLDAEDGSFHGEPEDDGFHVHRGFDRDELAGWLTDAGFGPTRFADGYEMERDGRMYGVFLATTRTPEP